jgi:hypothetical protein
MDKREVLMKIKVELRAFQHLLESYGDVMRAYEKWKEESRFDISWVLDEWIFDEGLSVDEIKERIDYWCKLIDEDLWWLERYPALGEYFDKLMEGDAEVRRWEKIW